MANNATRVNIVSISLTAGDWDVWGATLRWVSVRRRDDRRRLGLDSLGHVSSIRLCRLGSGWRFGLAGGKLRTDDWHSPRPDRRHDYRLSRSVGQFQHRNVRRPGNHSGEAKPLALSGTRRQTSPLDFTDHRRRCLDLGFGTEHHHWLDRRPSEGQRAGRYSIWMLCFRISVLSPSTSTSAPAIGPNCGIEFSNHDAGSIRWYLFDDGAAETGGNAGSNFRLNAYSDTGAVLLSPLQITTRATGLITVNYGLNVGGTLNVGGAVNASSFAVNGSSTLLTNSAVQFASGWTITGGAGAFFFNSPGRPSG